MTGGGYTQTEAWNLQLQHKVEKAEKKIAALEAAQEKIREKIGQLSDFPPRDALLRLVREIQTLISSEGAGEKSAGCPTCKSPDPAYHPVHPLWQDTELPVTCPDPFHSPTSAGEDREDKRKCRGCIRSTGGPFGSDGVVRAHPDCPLHGDHHGKED